MVVLQLLWFASLHFVICYENLQPSYQPIHVFALSCDWFIGLSVSVVIGQSDYFAFGLTTLN